MTVETIKQLDDAAVVRCLSYATDELREATPLGASIADADEARQLIEALLASGGSESAMNIVPIEHAAMAAAGRRLLTRMLDDAAVAPVVAPLVAAPPEHEQMGADTAVEAAIVLGALISWLQTKVSIDISRKGGKTAFQFKLLKSASSASTLKDVASWIKDIFVR